MSFLWSAELLLSERRHHVLVLSCWSMSCPRHCASTARSSGVSTGVCCSCRYSISSKSMGTKQDTCTPSWHPWHFDPLHHTHHQSDVFRGIWHSVSFLETFLETSQERFQKRFQPCQERVFRNDFRNAFLGRQQRTRFSETLSLRVSVPSFRGS